MLLAEKQTQLTRDYRSEVEKTFKTRKGLDYKAGQKTAYDSALKLVAVS